jgi:hypothetical protein
MRARSSVACAAALLMIACLPSLASARWSVQRLATPTAVLHGGFNAVWCNSSNACVGVGSSDAGAMQAERWNGSQWSLERVPGPAGGHSATLVVMSCASPTACTALGSYRDSSDGQHTLIERRNGIRWSIQQPLSPAGAMQASLTSVACPALRACTAVGSYLDANNRSQLLVERWDGTRWSIQQAPGPPNMNASPSLEIAARLNGVSCSSPSACTAVGSYSPQSQPPYSLPLVERWNGSSWSIQHPSTPARVTDAGLGSVSCPSASSCTAVGTFHLRVKRLNPPGPSQTLIEHWNGSTWSIEHAGTPVAVPAPASVTCASPKNCTVLWSNGADSYGQRALMEHWNGGAWSIQRRPEPAGAFGIALNGLSCPSPSSCVAVGSYGNRISAEQRLAERWNGRSWSALGSPDPIGAAIPSVTGIACPSSTACVAVGSYSDGVRPGLTLAERWNGARWSIQPTPDAAGGLASSGLAAVSCAAPTACTAIGQSSTMAGSEPLVERWNGARWSIQRIPTPVGGRYPRLAAISCPSSTSCTAIGSYSGPWPYPLVERWNGRRWSVVPTAKVITSLLAVSCGSATSCIAVGPGVVQRVDAVAEPIDTNPDLGSLDGISCTSPRACMAVGSYTARPYVRGEPNNPALTLVQRWNGRQWSVQTPRNPAGAEASNLVSASCASTTSCIAIGNSDLSQGRIMLAEHWNGRRWSLQQFRSPGGSDQVNPEAVSCATRTSCTAIAWYLARGHNLPLVEHWDGIG